MLIYLNNCGVDRSGQPNPFLTQEMEGLLHRFGQMALVCNRGIHTFAKGDQPPYSVGSAFWSGPLAFLKVPFQKDFYTELRRMKEDGVLSVKHFLQLVAFTQRGLKMAGWVEDLLRLHGDARTVLYSMWMSYDAYAGALVLRKHPHLKLIVRGHAYDVDTERNEMNPYLMKHLIGEKALGLYFINQTAKKQFLSYMKDDVSESKIHVLAMGSAGAPVENIHEPPLYAQGCMRVVSCGKVIPIKQIPLIAQALSQWDGPPLKWVHIGGGEGEEELKKLCAEKLDCKENVIYELLGNQTSEEIDKIYQSKGFDAIISASKKEGMPVSLMEAMRYGIPVIAPAVGGIPEMVGPDVGFLYDSADGSMGILDALQKMAALSPTELKQMHENAHRQWNENYCSQVLLPKLFKDVP